jgi:hypothetical protein
MKIASSFLESPSKKRTEDYVHADACVNEDKNMHLCQREGTQ